MDSFILAFKSLGPGRIMALLLGIGAVMWMTSEAARNLTQPGMGLLYGGLSSQEVAEISNLLDGSQTPYEIRGDSSIYVPSDQIGQLRLQTAGQGIVGSSMSGYEIFDNGSSFGTTSFVQNINARRALEGELSRTISSLPAVKSARVHLVMPRKTAFSTVNEEPSAAVALDLAGRKLDDGQVKSIASLVAAAAPELMNKNITIIDQRGSLLYDGRSQSPGSPGSADRMRRNIELSYEEKITAMLSRITGPGKVSVRVNAEVNLDQLEERSEIFDPQQQVVRSEQRSEITAESQETDGTDAVGVDGNIPGGGAAGTAGNAQQNESRLEETINYEIGRTVRNLTRQGGEIEKLSVAVLVEGKYEGEDGSSYVPYSDEQLANMERLVRTAAGMNENRGDTISIVDMPFTPVEEIEGEAAAMFSKGDIMSLAQYALLIIGSLGILLFLVKPALTVLANTTGQAVEVKIKQAVSQIEDKQTLTQAVSAAKEEAKVDMDKVEGQVKESSVKKVSELVSAHPDETLNVVRDWMADDGTTGQQG